MNILITGAGGFVGKNLVQNLKNLKDGKNCTYPKLKIENIFEYERHKDKQLLNEYCKKADFVFHLAGVNRPKDPKEFEENNLGSTELLLKNLEAHNNKAPIMFSSSIQASLVGKYEQSPYGRSKEEGEKLLFEYSRRTGAKIYIYRLPNLFGKWCRPDYNSVVATFCNNIATQQEYTVNDRSTELELVYIDDLIDEMIGLLDGKEHRCKYEGIHAVECSNGQYCYVPVSHHVTLGEIVDLLKNFKYSLENIHIPEMPKNSFAKKLYSTYLSYVPAEDISHYLTTKADQRGSFTELFKTEKCGQFSVNITRPGYTRGQHWHNSKWEIFVVVSGHGLIQERKLGTDKDGNLYPVIEFEVRGEQMKVIQMLPGYTHAIINLSETSDLITIMWANEVFDQNHPDTFFEKIDI